MKLQFNIEYIAHYGENLELNVVWSNQETSHHAMVTTDGRNWRCDLEMNSHAAQLDYYYSVTRNGVEIRHEWNMLPHRLDLSAARASRYTAFDHWIDMPDDSYLYSAAVTQCVANRKQTDTQSTRHACTVQLKARAPQLRSGQRLAVCGACAQLGEWDTARAVVMAEHAPNEWVATLNAAQLPTDVEFKFVALTEEGEPLWENGHNRSVTLVTLQANEVVVYELSTAYFPIAPLKVAGTVIPVFSLRSEKSFGVGDFGDLQRMIDWVALTGQRALQVLPINDTTITGTWQDSYPYNSISIYALHPQYIDINQLPPLADKKNAAKYEKLRKELNALPQIDYERVNEAKRSYLRDVFLQEGAKMLKDSAFKNFFTANKDWLVPYAAFCHYRDLYGTATFSQWPDHHTLSKAELAAMADSRTRIYKDLSFWYFVQYCLDKQMRAAHDHAHSRGVILKGDIPIGISRDGVEAWVEPRYFNLNGQAGAPPDAFSTNGQNWGFPTYDWDALLADGCSWWVKRFRKMAQYFDAYRIDHVLGFFRIWEIPIHAVHGLLGQFSPALGMSADEIRGYGFNFNESTMTKPLITDWMLERIFGKHATLVRSVYVERMPDSHTYCMRHDYDTQRKVEAAFAGKKSDDDIWVRDGLYALISNVLFVHDRKVAGLYHPRIAAQTDLAYETLHDTDKEAFNRLYNDYYYRRNNDFWYQEAMKKLPRLVEATRMLVCAEDLGMVPHCVSWVMNDLKILSLEIQSMPKDDRLKFGNLNNNPYRSVATISTHDMPTLRQWWEEDWDRTQQYYNTMLWRADAAPHPIPGWLAEDVVRNHLMSPSMLCLLSLQDWMAMDENVRLADADAERINVPANPRHYWRYRMHLSIEQLMQTHEFNKHIKELVTQSGRL